VIDHVQHEQPESKEDMFSFGEQKVCFETAHEIVMELAQQFAGVDERVSNGIRNEVTEIVDEDSFRNW
jgi:hypothetical protein